MSVGTGIFKHKGEAVLSGHHPAPLPTSQMPFPHALACFMDLGRGVLF